MEDPHQDLPLHALSLKANVQIKLKAHQHARFQFREDVVGTWFCVVQAPRKGHAELADPNKPAKSWDEGGRSSQFKTRW